MKYTSHITRFLLYCILGVSCRKMLEALPNSRYHELTTLTDCWTLLDLDKTMNVTPTLGELSADAYYLKENTWQHVLKGKEKNAYVWASDIFELEKNDNDWTLPYEQVYRANVVLEALQSIQETAENKVEHQAVRGSALFMRAFAFFNIAQLFAKPYDAASAAGDMGIPLRLNTHIQEVSVRSTNKHTYQQILKDLEEALGLLPFSVDVKRRNRPSSVGAMALLARVYLSMRDYTNAAVFADRCLENYQQLMNYNGLDSTVNFPFSKLNPEVIYQARFHSGTLLLNGYAVKLCIVDPELYQSYEPDDLRRVLFFRKFIDNLPYAKGSYAENYLPFSGLATDEMYLIRAECAARSGNTTGAVSDLNTLLQNRYRSGTFVPFSPANADDVIRWVLTERKKELIFRGLRWIDIRRLNKENFNITLQRTIGGSIYTLSPGDERFTMPIPQEVIEMTGIPQNPR